MSRQEELTSRGRQRSCISLVLPSGFHLAIPEAQRMTPRENASSAVSDQTNGGPLYGAILAEENSANRRDLGVLRLMDARVSKSATLESVGNGDDQLLSRLIADLQPHSSFGSL